MSLPHVRMGDLLVVFGQRGVYAIGTEDALQADAERQAEFEREILRDEA